MPRQNPLERMIEQTCHRIRLHSPIVPADIPASIEPLVIPAPPQMVAGKEKAILIQKCAMAFGVTERRNDEEIRFKLNGFISFDDDLGIRLGGKLVTMNNSFGMKMLRKLLRISHIVPVRQEYAPDASELFKFLHEKMHKFWRIDQPVAVSSPDEVAVTAERVRRIESTITYVTFNCEGKVVIDFLYADFLKRADRTGGASEKCSQCRAPFFAGLGL